MSEPKGIETAVSKVLALIENGGGKGRKEEEKRGVLQWIDRVEREKKTFNRAFFLGYACREAEIVLGVSSREIQEIWKNCSPGGENGNSKFCKEIIEELREMTLRKYPKAKCCSKGLGKDGHVNLLFHHLSGIPRKKSAHQAFWLGYRCRDAYAYGILKSEQLRSLIAV